MSYFTLLRTDTLYPLHMFMLYRQGPFYTPGLLFGHWRYRLCNVCWVYTSVIASAAIQWQQDFLYASIATHLLWNSNVQHLPMGDYCPVWYNTYPAISTHLVHSYIPLQLALYSKMYSIIHTHTHTHTHTQVCVCVCVNYYGYKILAKLGFIF